MVDSWIIVAGALLPFLIAQIQNNQWTDRKKAIIAFATCAIFATAGAIIDKSIAMDIPSWVMEIIGNTLMVAVIAMGLYRGFYNKVGLAQPLNLFGPHTTKPPTPQPPPDIDAADARLP